MKTILRKPHSIHHIGGRSNNEDSIFPLQGKATANDQLFLVCDGVGGNEKGEVASQLACEKFAEYFTNNPKPVSDEAFVNEALKFTEDAFDDYIEKHPESKGMGTTLTLLHFHEQGASIAHIGDSRIYQIRNGKIIHQTSDHSLVNDLLKGGIITEEQAKYHPRKNVISRAIQGASVKTTKAEVKQITDIQANDYFFLCTDGILENISDFEISQILLLDKSNAEKMAMIQKRCEEAPNDNFSAYLIQVEQVEGAMKSEDEVVASIISDEEVVIASVNEIDKKPQYQQQKPTDNKKKVLYLLIILLLVYFGYKLLNKEEHKVQETKPKTEIKTDTVESTENNDMQEEKQSNEVETLEAETEATTMQPDQNEELETKEIQSENQDLDSK